jgi:uncharacterized protein
MRVAVLLLSFLVSQTTLAAQGALESPEGERRSKDQELYDFTRLNAERGLARDQTILGILYEAGRGVDQDYEKAAFWYRKAAEQGDAQGQNHLGLVYAAGRGVELDHEKAAGWYRKAADQGLSVAQGNLGNCYASGKGVEQDYVLAASWYRKSAEQGHPKAQYNLASLLTSGQGVERDDVQAVDWYRKAADQGDPGGKYGLGYMYENGRGGVDQDSARAVYWYARAAQGGLVMTGNNLKNQLLQLDALNVARPSINLLAKPNADAEIIGSLAQGSIVYRLKDVDSGWYEVYAEQGHKIGYVSSSLVTKVGLGRGSIESSGGFPPPPAPRDGYVTCSTRCINADCYRSYSDGRQVRFQARQVWDAFNSTFTFDSGGC